MGGGTEADLTHGAVAAMSGLQAAEGLRPVLQLAEAPRPAGIHPTERYGLVLSDGVHSQQAVLAASTNGLVRAGLLRVGSVVRVLDYVCSSSVENRRVIIVIKLEILQTECMMIGNPTIYKVNAAQQNMGPCSDILGIHGHSMMSKGKQGVTKIACSPDQNWLGCSKAARNGILQRLYGLVPTRNRIHAKMHHLSLNSYQGQVPSAVGVFDWPGNTESTVNVCRTIAQIKDENFGMSSQPDLITVVAAISYVHTDAFCYPACTLMFNGKQCNRKVTANGNGWWCNRCLRSSATCEYRYLLTCQIHDHSGSTYATAFHEAAEEIIGHKAQELFTIKDVQQDDEKFEGIMLGILWGEYQFKLRVKERAGHGVKKFSIIKAEKLDPSDMNRRVLGEIDDLLKGDSSSAPGAQGIVNPSLQARLTAQRSNNAYGGGMTIGSTSYAHPVHMLGQASTPPQATPRSMHAECFRCNRGARSPMIPVGSPTSEAPSMQAECFRCIRSARSRMIQ